MLRKIAFVFVLLSVLCCAFFSWRLVQLYKNEHRLVGQQVHAIKQQLLTIYDQHKSATPSQLIRRFRAIEYSQNVALMIVDQQGQIIASPNQKFIGSPIDALSRISPDITQYVRDSLSKSSKQPFIVVHDVDSSLMIIGVVWPLDKTHSLLMIKKKSSSAYFKFLEKKRRILFFLTLSIGLLLVSGMVLALHGRVDLPKIIMSVIIIFCLISIISMVQLIYFRTPDSLPGSVKPLYSQYQIQAMINQYKKHKKDNILLPFGVYITNLSFPSESVVDLSMWLWFKDGKLPSGKPINILLTQKISGNPSHINTRSNHNLERYNSVKVKQNFSQTRYPFDDRYVDLEFWHTDVFNPNIILYPDIGGYNLSNPEDLLTPQMDPTVKIKDWNIIESFYAITPMKSNSDLGHPIGTIDKLSDRVLLVILLRRDFTGPLMKFYLPLLIVLIMYYIGILLMQEDQIFRTLTYNASLLFVITLAASRARSYVATNDISFIEVMYVIVYGVIVLFSFSQLGHTYIKDRLKYIDIHQVLKFIYWPSICIAVLVNTVLYFW